jgi:hypothetical protein
MSLDDVVLSVVINRFAAQEAVENRQSLVQHGRAQSRPCRLPECAILSLGWNAETDADDHSASAQVIERDDLFRELPRTTAGDGGDHGAESDPAGPGRNSTEQHPRIVHRRPSEGVELKVIP